MPRTQAQLQAVQRDGKWCLWHRYGSLFPALVPLTDAHHLARRQPNSDKPELIVGLCHACHMGHHNGLNPTTGQLLDLMRDQYGLNLRRDFPLFFANY